MASFESNFFLGSDTGRWATHVSSFDEVVYPGIYRGIDAHFRLSAQGLKYEFYVAPGADSSAIRLRYEGLEGLSVLGNELLLETPVGEIHDSEPVGSQAGREVVCSFVLRVADTVGFECPGRDHSVPLLIDPLVYSTFYGGRCDDVGRTTAYDSAGHVLVLGTTECDVPIAGSTYDASFNGAYDVFIAKFDTSGLGLVYATYLGGSGGEYGNGIALDRAGNVYIAGETYSTDFPTTPGAYDKVHSGGGDFDGYVSKLNPAGDALVYSTFIGNATIDVNGLAVDNFGFAFVTGSTCTTSFPLTPGAFQTSMTACPAAFVVKLRQDGSAPVYGTLLDGSADTTGRAIAVDSGGNAYVTGETNARDFPVTPGAFDTTFNSYYPGPGGTTVMPDAFVTKVNPSGSALVYSTFLGGAGYDFSFALALDSAGDAFLAGRTNSTNFPTTPGAFSPVKHQWDEAFVTKLNARGSALIYGTYLGGARDESADGLAIDGAGDAYVVGSTNSPDFPTTPGALRTSFGGGNADAYLSRLRADGRSLVYSTFLGGLGYDGGLGAAVWPGKVVVVGATTSTDYPTTPGAFDTTANGGMDAFLSEFTTSPLPDYVPANPHPSAGVVIGRSLPVALSVDVRNLGEAANASTSLAFYNATTPSQPFAVFPVPPLGSGGSAGPYQAAWVSSATIGSYQIVARADSGNNLTESNEMNNNYTWTIDVVPGPITSLDVGVPSYIAGATYVTSSTPLSFAVLDQSGTGIRNTTYRVDDGPWVNYTAAGPFRLATEGAPRLEWFSEDNAGNVEAIRNATVRVDDTPPVTTLSIGDPKYAVGGTHVTSATPFTLQATDGGVTPVGVSGTEYRIDGGSWQPYAAPLAVAGDGTHVLEYRSADLLGNQESPIAATLSVDNAPPAVTVDVGSPRYIAADLFVTSATAIGLSAVDGGSAPAGLASLEYRVGGAWIPYTGPFALTGPDGSKTVAYRAMDHVGNTASGDLTVVLDDTAPVTTISPGSGTYAAGTQFALTASDAGSGVDSTEYRVDGGTWTAYAGPFALPQGDHTIRYRSTDHLANGEAEQTVAVRVSGPPIPFSAEVNWKPFVAAAFVAMLVAFGIWSARRRPWRTGTRPALRAFGFASLPFVLAEASTGVASLFTGVLSIPPILGIGTGVDVAILAAGVIFAFLRTRGEEPRGPARTTIR